MRGTLGMRLIPNIKIGVTGKLGAGKSTVARILAGLGANIIDADKIGWQILQEKRDEIVNLLGREVLEGERIDRKKVAKIVFSSKDKLEQFEAIVHPPLLEQLKKRLQRPGVVVVDAALIPYWGIEDWFDYVIWVDAPWEVRLDRMKRRGYSESDIVQRERMQDFSPQRVDFYVKNDGDMEALVKQVRRIWEKILREASDIGGVF